MKIGKVQDLAAKIRYVINPADEYPRNFTGHLRAVLKNGEVRELRQPFMRGGAHSPLTVDELEAKCLDNAKYGGWPSDRAKALLLASRRIFGGADLNVLGQLRA